MEESAIMPRTDGSSFARDAAAAGCTIFPGIRSSVLSIVLLLSVNVDTAAVPPHSPLPPWDWSRLHTWCFPGCDPSDGQCVPARYTSADAAHFSRFDLVLFQGQNYSGSRGHWVANEECESVMAAETIRAAGGQSNKPTFPYIQWSMPQAWYEHQRHFNTPTPSNKAMWLKDSSGNYIDANNVSGAAGLNEGADYPFPWRRLYDWRVPEARHYFVKHVLSWVLGSAAISGAFFDDVNAIATNCIYGISGIPSANGTKGRTGYARCGNWTASDALNFERATVQTVKDVLQAFASVGKWPLLSIRQDGTINAPLRRFQEAVNPLLKPHGAFRFMEALCQQYTDPCTIYGVLSNASACCVSQVEELIAQAAIGVPLAVHGWAQGGSRDVLAAGGDGSMWAEHSFPWFPEFSRPLGRPLGPPTRHSWGVWTRNFEQVDVMLDVNPAGAAKWNATLAWRHNVSV